MTSRGPRRPDAGRIYDALLGGKDNFAEDRQAAARLIAAVPGIAAAARRATTSAMPRTGGRHRLVLLRPGDGPSWAARRRGMPRRAGAGAGTGRPGLVPGRHREEAMTLTLMRAACRGQASGGAQDGVPGSRAARTSRPGGARRA